MVELEDSDQGASLFVYWCIKDVLLISFGKCLSGLSLSKSRPNKCPASCRRSVRAAVSGNLDFYPGLRHNLPSST